LGLPLIGRSEVEIDEESADRVRRRDQARDAGDWAEADSLRSDLEGSGWVVEDSPEGTRLRRR
jgi:cysteinyl-tRNA synthetase